MIAILLILSIISVVNAGCDNQCSGHGVCGTRGVCECYDNWGMGHSRDSGDCSERICPFEFAWVDKPNQLGLHHQYAECSARGICDRGSGDCECFPGYEGKACQRTTCPNDCSGHGQCAYIEDMPFAPSHMDGPGRGYSYDDEPVTFNYNGWDEMKTRGCVCDPEYGDVDCSKRLCQHATDVMDNRDNMAVAGKYHTQSLTLVADRADLTLANPTRAYALASQTFALKFVSKLNETFYTQPISYPTDGADCHAFTVEIQRALLKLPNGVIDGVRVSAACDTYLGVANTFANAGTEFLTQINVTFTGASVQGSQNTLQAVVTQCLDGCSPKISGLELYPRTMNATESITSDYNSYECGNRGKCDYTSGTCSCFEGYTGLGCNIITSLV
jgi:hypothetical protein